MRHRIAACLSKIIRYWADFLAKTGLVDTFIRWFYIYSSFFAFGSPHEQDGLLRKVIKPIVCTSFQAAEFERMRRRTDVQRLIALGCMPFELPLSYRALKFIFGVVFENAKPKL